MIKLAIRDDDLNYFSKVKDVVGVYKEISFCPVSFAVIPTVTDVSTKGRCLDTRGNITPRWVGDNTELVDWLKDELSKRQADVLLHGITHEYKFFGGNRYAEMQWRNEPNLAEEISMQKERLSNLLNYPITVFVAPSNKISKYGMRAVSSSGMHYSGIVPSDFQRDLTIRNMGNYIKRWFYRAKDNLPYPAVMQYSDHREVNACLMQGYDYLIKMFHYCEKNNYPMAVNVHYWHLRDNGNERKQLSRFIDYALKHKAIPTTMSELLK